MIKTTHTHRQCRECGGDGGITVNDTNPYGYGPDPQCDVWVECMTCLGEGEIMCVPEDPIKQLKRYRVYASAGASQFVKKIYKEYRQFLFAPVPLPKDLHENR